MFLKSGTTFRPTSKDSMDLHDMLPADNYTVKKDQHGQLYLEKIESFTPIGKYYGNTLKHTSRIVNTFGDRIVSTGVMLTGEKGSGKTLLAKNVSIELAKSGVPTIVINQPWVGDQFNKLLQDITQPCVILFDEFEKTYDREEQEKILTLLDGVFGSKKLYMFTCNDKHRVDYHMKNRPGRIFYMIDFAGLSIEFIEEYCNDNLKNKANIQTVINISSLFSKFNFDMLASLLQEMNRYDETAQEALAILNIKPEFDMGTQYGIELFDGNKAIPDCSRMEFDGNPLSRDGIELGFTKPVEGKDSDDLPYTYEVFDVGSLVNMDAGAGKFTFSKNGIKLVLTKIKKKEFNYLNAF